ncbi:hypothetical protein VNO78_24481 [Psophocarpus tetragonolobus]|uniref:Uncharacterized protein n=1 Tax=Psophocarpus tetragonolobus TaxID=3891 RepID=A0AAN9XEN8_PSOTE
MPPKEKPKIMDIPFDWIEPLDDSKIKDAAEATDIVVEAPVVPLPFLTKLLKKVRRQEDRGEVLTKLTQKLKIRSESKLKMEAEATKKRRQQEHAAKLAENTRRKVAQVSQVIVGAKAATGKKI